MNNKKTAPYIGVTGFMDRSEIEDALSVITPESSRLLMVGVLVSGNVLANREQKRFAARYPKLRNIAELFIDHPGVLNIAHFHYSEPSSPAVYGRLKKLVEVSGPNLHGIQLNFSDWPNIEALEKFHKEYPELRIIMPITADIMKKWWPESCAEVVRSYHPLISSVLIDASGGRGLALDVKGAESYLREFAKIENLGIGVAGGLGSYNLDIISDLIRRYPSLSIDAEGALRNGEDKLVRYLMKEYLKKGIIMLGGREWPGTELVKHDSPYKYDKFMEHFGTGTNMLRTTKLCQPAALQPGDRLATGEVVLSEPREAGNGGVFIHLSGPKEGVWIRVPSRLPLALLTDDAPDEVWEIGNSDMDIYKKPQGVL